MRINAINQFQYSKKVKNINRVKTSNQNFSAQYKGPEDSFFYKLKKRLNPDIETCYEDLPDKQIVESRAIASLCAKYKDNFEELNKSGKYYWQELKLLVKLGSKNGWHSTPYSKTPNSTITFGPIDEFIEIPSTMCIWEQGNPSMQYEVLTKDPRYMYKITDMAIKNKKTIYYFLEDRFISCSEFDLRTNKAKRFVATQEGFVFQEGIMKPDNEQVKIETECNYDYKDPTNRLYAQRNRKGEREAYRYDFNKKMWLLEKD